MAEPLVRGSLWTQDPGGASAVLRGSVWCFIHTSKSSIHRRTSCEGLSPSSTPTQDAAGPAVPPHLPLLIKWGCVETPAGLEPAAPGSPGPAAPPGGSPRAAAGAG